MLPFPILAADVSAQAAIVQGYDSNTFQTQPTPTGPITRHPALYTGVNASFGSHVASTELDVTDVRLFGRLQHYEPLDAASSSDDGSIGALVVSSHAIAEKTRLAGTLTLALSSLNSSHASDGTMLDTTPLASRATYWSASLAVAITHELTSTTRLVPGVGARVGGTLDETFVAGASALPFRTFDYLAPFASLTLAHDESPVTTLEASLIADYTYTFATYDLTATPPRDLGGSGFPDLTAAGAWRRLWTDDLTTYVRAGATVATPGADAPSQRPYVTPLGTAALFYQRDLWTFVASAGYQFASLTPGVGAGASAFATLTAIGRPVPRGAWRDLYLVIAANGTHTWIDSGVEGATGASLASGSVELRYGLSRWLGLVLGTDARYTVYDATTPVPSFFREVVFAGVSGAFASDDAVPPLATTILPTKPGM